MLAVVARSGGAETELIAHALNEIGTVGSTRWRLRPNDGRVVLSTAAGRRVWMGLPTASRGLNFGPPHSLGDRGAQRKHIRPNLG